MQLLTHGRLDLCASSSSSGDRAHAGGSRRAAANGPHADAAFNVAAAGGLVLGLHTGDTRLIAAGMHDRLHEPYRARLFPHLQVLIAAARGAGALGACLSGAGPSVCWPSRIAPTLSPGLARRRLPWASRASGATARRSGGCGDHRRERPRSPTRRPTRREL